MRENYGNFFAATALFSDIGLAPVEAFDQQAKCSTPLRSIPLRPYALCLDPEANRINRNAVDELGLGRIATNKQRSSPSARIRRCPARTGLGDRVEADWGSMRLSFPQTSR